MFRKVLIIFMFLFTWGGSVFAGDLEMDSFFGSWQVDFERSMESFKQSPKYDEQMTGNMEKIVRNFMRSMVVELNAGEMIYTIKNKKNVFLYEVQSKDENAITVVIDQMGREITIVFSMVDSAYMNFKSSGSDDMDYYIWKKIEN